MLYTSPGRGKPYYFHLLTSWKNWAYRILVKNIRKTLESELGAP
jgi:hypothetical protein